MFSLLFAMHVHSLGLPNMDRLVHSAVTKQAAHHNQKR